MHSKIINPKMHGRAVYENKGSSKSLVAYLQHEAKEKGTSLTFFDEDAEGIPAGEVQQNIDYNVKGLRKKESKFIALVLSPSQDELRHIRNDPTKLKQFTRRAMQNYAANFQLKGGKTLGSRDLLWYGAIHHDRTYKGNDRGVTEGRRRSGERKPGLQMHVHVIVSKRDQEQKITLSPFGSRDRFHMQAWQNRNQESFNGMFAYHSLQQTTGRKRKAIDAAKREHLHARITARVERINLYLDKPHKLEAEKVLAVAERRAYHQTFFFNLNRLEEKLKNYRYVRDPMHLLEYNRDRKPVQQAISHSLAATLKQMAAAGRKMGFTEQLSLKEIVPKKRRKKDRQQD